MISELAALKSVLGPANVGGAHLVQNTDAAPKLPYILIEPQGGNPFVEPSLEGEDGDFDLTFRLKGVGANADAALIALRNAKSALTGGKRRGVLPVAGRRVDVEYVRHEADFIDTQTLLPATSSSVSISVDTYRLISQPA